METINNIQLTDENIYPDESVLKKVLGKTYNAYLDLIKLFDNNDLIYEWRYSKDGKTWLCKVQKKKNDCMDVCLEGIYEGCGIFPGEVLRRYLQT